MVEIPQVYAEDVVRREELELDDVGGLQQLRHSSGGPKKALKSHCASGMAFGLLVAHGIKPDKQPRYMNDFDRPWNLRSMFRKIIPDIHSKALERYVAR